MSLRFLGFDSLYVILGALSAYLAYCLASGSISFTMFWAINVLSALAFVTGFWLLFRSRLFHYKQSMLGMARHNTGLHNFVQILTAQ